MPERPVTQLMTSDIVTVDQHASLERAAEVMETGHISSVLVTAAGAPAGIITEHDILRALQRELAPGQAVATVMGRPLVSARQTLSVREAYHLMTEKGVRHLLVTDAGGAPAGIVSESDFRFHLGLDFYRRLQDVRTVMRAQVPLLAPAAPLRQAVALMAAREMNCVIVASDGVPLGIITERDAVRFYRQGNATMDRPLAELMSSPVDTIALGTRLHDAMDRMHAQRIRHLVVLGHDGLVAGILSEHDVVRQLETEYLDFSLQENRQTRQQLRDSELFSDDVIGCLPGIFYVLDQRGGLLRHNHRLCEISGYSHDEMAGMRARDFFDADDAARVERAIGAALAHGEASVEATLLTRDGRRVPYYFSGRRTRIQGRPHVVGLGLDLTLSKQAEEKIQYLAQFDTLTGLPNRSQLGERAGYALGLARHGGGPVAVMFLDLDHFKDINDTLGHSVGDTLLVELAKRLRARLSEADTVARLGGDEFIFLLPGVDVLGAAELAQALLAAVATPCRIEQHQLNVTASIGIALYPADGLDFETLCQRADAAMYRVKQEGRHGYRFYTSEMQDRSARHLQLVNALRHALARGQLHVHYQPQVAIGDERVIGAEALLRWTHPELGPVSPCEFIPAAEESGLILPIGEWVLRQAVRQARRWRDDAVAPLVMAVNLSAVQFRHPDLPALVTRILEEEGLPAACLELELTESVAMHDPQGAIATMNQLHARGVRMAIDDFGTGYSSLSHLKKFKVYKLKIDQSFVRDISTDPEDKAIVGAIIQMAKSLGLRTIAEGVETAGQLAFLREQGCDEIQGYYYSAALPAVQFEAFARAHAGPLTA